MSAKTASNPTPLDVLRACATALDDKKAESIRILDLEGKSSLADFFIVATGNSEPHLRALSQAVDKVLGDLGVPVHAIDSDVESGWVVVDAYDFMIHLFTEEKRKYYALESLWKDAREVPLA